MKKSFKKFVLSLSLAAFAIAALTRLGVFKDIGAEKRRIYGGVNSVKEYNFSGIAHELSEYYAKENKFPVDINELKSFINKNAFYNTEILYDPFAGIYPYTIGVKKTADKAKFDDLAKVVKNEYELFQYDRTSDNKCCIWSYGPDGDDDKHSIEYNPKNGLKSNGDIALCLEAENDGLTIYRDGKTSRYKRIIHRGEPDYRFVR